MMLRLFLAFVLLCAQAAGAEPAAAPVQVITQAASVNSDAPSFPVDAAATSVTLPDNWAETRARHDGSVWYRARWDRPAAAQERELLAIYIERVCSNVEVYVNGRFIANGGRMTEPVTRNCYTPLLVTVPPALVQVGVNLIDLRVHGHAVGRVAARQRAGGLSALQVGPQSALNEAYQHQVFWNVRAVQLASVALFLIGVLTATLGWMNRARCTSPTSAGWRSGWRRCPRGSGRSTCRSRTPWSRNSSAPASLPSPAWRCSSS